MFGRTITARAREAMRRLTARPILAGLRSSGARRTFGDPLVLPGLDTRPAPMRPLRPPAAVNDNPLGSLEAEVERDLRARGYLH